MKLDISPLSLEDLMLKMIAKELSAVVSESGLIPYACNACLLFFIPNYHSSASFRFDSHLFHFGSLRWSLLSITSVQYISAWTYRDSHFRSYELGADAMHASWEWRFDGKERFIVWNWSISFSLLHIQPLYCYLFFAFRFVGSPLKSSNASVFKVNENKNQGLSPLVVAGDGRPQEFTSRRGFHSFIVFF